MVDSFRISVFHCSLQLCKAWVTAIPGRLWEPFPTQRLFIIVSLSSLGSPTSDAELLLEQNRGCAVNYLTVTQMKLIYYCLRVKIKQKNTFLIAVSTIKLWLIYKLGFYYLLQFIHTLSGNSWWATKDCSHFFS